MNIHHIDQIGNNYDDRITQSEVLISKDYGMKLRIGIFDSNDKENILKSEAYFSAKEKTYIQINHFSKSYKQIKIDETLLKPGTDEYTDPYELVKNFLKNGYKSLGKSTIDGIEVEVFQTSNKAKVNDLKSNSETKLYVDTKTQLPVKIETNTHIEGRIDRADVVSDLQDVRYDFQWNVPVNVADFEPNIPADYTSRSDTLSKTAPAN